MHYSDHKKIVDPGAYFRINDIKKSKHIPDAKEDLHDLLDEYLEQEYKYKGCEPQFHQVLQRSYYPKRE